MTLEQSEERLAELEEIIREHHGVEMEVVQTLIKEECERLYNLLIYKNTKYGNSAMRPKRIFSKASASEAILVRIDDKLSRIAESGYHTQADEDTVQDLGGYLILLQVAERLAGNGPKEKVETNHLNLSTESTDHS